MSEKPYSAACERNREPILARLRSFFDDRCHVLEVGSGTGQHAVHFAAAMPQLTWQSSDREEYLPGIHCPVLAIQGVDDEYATLAQIDAIERQVSGPFQRMDLPECRHTPWRDQPDVVADAIARFVSELQIAG